MTLKKSLLEYSSSLEYKFNKLLLRETTKTKSMTLLHKPDKKKNSRISTRVSSNNFKRCRKISYIWSSLKIGNSPTKKMALLIKMALGRGLWRSGLLGRWVLKAK